MARSKGKFFLTLFVSAKLLVAALAPSLVQAEETNSACKLNFILSFKTSGIPRFPNEDLDYCKVRDKDLNSELSAVMDRMGSIHDKVAHALSTTPDKLFSLGGVHIRLEGSSAGSLGYSHDARNTITVTAFPDEINLLSESTYTHEVGHFVATATHYSPNVRKLLETPLLVEGFPDLIATLITGKPSWPADLPECFGRALRRSTFGSGFDSSQTFFSKDSFAQEFAKCCDSPELADPKHRKVVNLCSEMKLKMKENIENSFNSSIFKPEKCFNTENGTFDPSLCDDHQIGIPLNEFFALLDKKLKKTGTVNLLFEALRNLRAQTSKNNFSCGLKISSHLNSRINVEETRLTANQLLQAIFALLPLEEQPKFDELWKAFGMAKWIELDEVGAARRAQSIAFQLLTENEWPLSFREQNKGCEGRIVPFANPQFPECEISCVLTQSEAVTLKFNILKKPQS